MTAGEGARGTRAGVVGRFIVLIAIAGLGPMSINIIVPSLPGIARDLGSDYALTQLTLSLFLASMALFLIVAGPLADALGRRPVLFAGLAVFLAATAAAWLAPSIHALIGARVVQGMGAGVCVVIGRAIIGDLYDRDRAASMIGYVTMGYGLAPMLAPAAGGLIDQWYGWRVSFLFLAACGIAVTLLAWRVLPETARPSHEASEPLLAAIAGLARVPAFWAVALANSLGASTYFTFLGGGAFVGARVLGLSPSEFGAYFMLAAAGYIAGNWLTGRKAGAVGPLRLLRAGSLLILGSGLAMWLSDLLGQLGPLTFFLPTFVLGVGNGLVTPNCLALAMSIRPRLAGTAAGVASGLALGVGGLASTLVGIWLGHDGRALPLLAQVSGAGALTVVCAFVASRLMRWRS
jgi:DHA1 family bicyclomycin/chloramphenicol resistance-like MFS transporter